MAHPLPRVADLWLTTPELSDLRITANNDQSKNVSNISIIAKAKSVFFLASCALGTSTKRQVSKRQVSKRQVSKRPVSKRLKCQVYKTSGLQNVRFTKRQVFKTSGC
jgi:hypothetical protein